MDELKKKSYWKTYLLTLLISIVVGGGFFCLFFFTSIPSLASAYDASILTGLILLCVGGIIFVAREGFFDIFAYGFKQFGGMFFSKKANSSNDYPKYLEKKKESRKYRSKYYLFICLAGLLYVTAFIVLRIAYEYQINIKFLNF